MVQSLQNPSCWVEEVSVLAPLFRTAIRQDPARFCEEWLGVKLWDDQKQVLRAIFRHNRVAWRSGNGVGKTMMGACAAICKAIGEASYVIISSSSWQGVTKALFPEIRKLLVSLPEGRSLGGEVLETEWKLGPQWKVFGISAKDPENFSGFRTNKGVAVIFDEASALRRDIYEAIEGLCSSSLSSVLLMGNPLRPHGPFFDAFHDPSWKTFHTSTLDNPNVKSGKEVIPGLASRKWVEKRRDSWGTDSTTYQARVLGQFPSGDSASIIPHTWFDRIITKDQSKDTDLHKVRLGVDVARSGSDRTVFLFRDDEKILKVDSATGRDLMDTVGRVVRFIEDGEVLPESVFIDDTGLGGGVTDRLLELNYSICPVNFGEKADEDDRFLNKRAECYWRIRDAVNPTQKEEGVAPFRIASCYRGVLSEAMTPEVQYTSKGQIKLEPKDKVKERLGRSPDLADALALTFATLTVDDMVLLM